MSLCIAMISAILFVGPALFFVLVNGIASGDVTDAGTDDHEDLFLRRYPELEQEDSMNRNKILQEIYTVLMAEGCVDPPDVCPNSNVTFWLYTRETQSDPTKIDEDSLQNLKYGKEHPWKLLIHGYTGHRNYAPNVQLRPAFFKKGDYNIITVDYGPLVRSPCYPQSVYNVPLIANCTAQMIDMMVEKGIFDLEDLHVIGFSLGGQVAGHLSNYITSGKLRRITGLDPALPLFLVNAVKKLDESDAEFVDVIHTDAAKKGKLERSGHIDFYPNGGYNQVGCTGNENVSKSSCNHLRAVKYYAESISSTEGFWGIPCSWYLSYYFNFCKAKESDLVIMGEYTPETARGVYYLRTNSEPPYALGKVLSTKKLPSHSSRPQD